VPATVPLQLPSAPRRHRISRAEHRNGPMVAVGSGSSGVPIAHRAPRSRMDHQLGTRAVTSLSTASQLPPRPPSDRPAFSRQYRILTIDRGEVYRASSQAGPGNDINAGSTGSQKAPTWSPASLVAFRANAGRAASRRSLSAPLSLTARQSPVFSGAGVSAFRLRTMLRQVVEEVGTATA